MSEQKREWWIYHHGGKSYVNGPDTPHAGGIEVHVVEASALAEAQAEIEELKNLVSFAEKRGYAARETEHANDRRLCNSLQDQLTAANAKLEKLKDALRDVTACDLDDVEIMRHRGRKALAEVEGE